MQVEAAANVAGEDPGSRIGFVSLELHKEAVKCVVSIRHLEVEVTNCGLYARRCSTEQIEEPDERHTIALGNGRQIIRA